MSVEERRAARLDNALVGGLSAALVAGFFDALSTELGGDAFVRAAEWAAVGGIVGATTGFMIDPEGAT
jgi:hypothetical protein